jgi:hypothetical protein
MYYSHTLEPYECTFNLLHHRSCCSTPSFSQSGPSRCTSLRSLFRHIILEPHLLQLFLLIYMAKTNGTKPYSGSVIGHLYSVQYKSIFGTPDKFRRNTYKEARPSRLDFQRDEAVLDIKTCHVIGLFLILAGAVCNIWDLFWYIPTSV